MKKQARHKSKAWIFWLVLIIIILVLFILPMFPKYEKQSYQETVNYDNCDSSAGCVCKQKGGFLWLTCKQCSCTRYREVARYVTLFQLMNDKG
jgi:hypothetical protein